MSERIVDPRDLSVSEIAEVAASIWARRDLKPTDKTVLLYLLDPEHRFYGETWNIQVRSHDKLVLLRVVYADLTGQTRPTVADICADTRLHEPLVKAALRRLEKAGHLAPRVLS